MNRREAMIAAVGAATLPMASGVANAAVPNPRTLEGWLAETKSLYGNQIGADFYGNPREPHFEERKMQPVMEQINKYLKELNAVERRRSMVEWTDEDGKAQTRLDIWYERVS